VIVGSKVRGCFGRARTGEKSFRARNGAEGESYRSPWKGGLKINYQVGDSDGSGCLGRGGGREFR